MQPQQQQMAVIGAAGVPQPYVISTAPTRPLSHQQVTAVAVMLIIVGCLSILFNTIDLTIGTGRPFDTYNIYQREQYNNYYGNYYSGNGVAYNRYDDDSYPSLSISSFGVAGHGFWCGLMVSQLRNLDQSWQSFPL